MEVVSKQFFVLRRARVWSSFPYERERATASLNITRGCTAVFCVFMLFWAITVELRSLENIYEMVTKTYWRKLQCDRIKKQILQKKSWLLHTVFAHASNPPFFFRGQIYSDMRFTSQTTKIADYLICMDCSIWPFIVFLFKMISLPLHNSSRFILFLYLTLTLL